MSSNKYLYRKSCNTRYFLFISYKGTSYHGWQIQPGSVSVQKILGDALSLIIGEKISVTGAGRTDTGVHARFFCAHIDSSYEDLDSRKNLLFRINKFLPGDISINSIKKVIPGAHARFSATSRTYEYLISRSKDPFLEGSAWYLYGDLNIEDMNSACRIMMQHIDFTSFSKLHTDVKTNICRIMHSEWREEGTLLVFTIKADRFLRNMVRAIVGTMVDIGKGKTSLEEFEKIILSHDRCMAGQSAPAGGLFLTGIEYPEEIFILKHQ